MRHSIVKIKGKIQRKDYLLSLQDLLKDGVVIPDPVCPECRERLRKETLPEKLEVVYCPICEGIWSANRFCIFCGKAGRQFEHLMIFIEIKDHVGSFDIFSCEKCSTNGFYKKAKGTLFNSELRTKREKTWKWPKSDKST